MVQDDLELPDDNREVPKPNGVVSGSIPGREIISLLDRKPTRWSNTSLVPKVEINMRMFLNLTPKNAQKM